MNRVLQVFARAPVPGQCKTRLVPALGAEGAAELHRRLLLRTLDAAFEAGRRLGGVRVELWCTPGTDHPFFRSCADRQALGLRVQRGYDLGARMHEALADAIGQGALPLLVGTDCPSLDAALFEQAFAAIESPRAADVVLLPTEDGGYALIGGSRCDRSMFEGVPWSTDTVFTETRARIERLGWRMHALPVTWDVDRPADLDRLRRQAPQLLLDLPAAGA